MKKNRIFLRFLVLILFTVFLSITCKQNIGLGGTVDIERPDGQITYPDAGETPIRGSFVMKGYARDDDGIKSITILFKNIETKETVGPYSVGGFTEGDGSVSWSITIPNESKSFEDPPHELVKKYPIPDGEYTAILTVTDKGGKTYETTKNYKIDNTPPVFIVQRPSTSISKSVRSSATLPADGYGATFSVVGQAGEKNTVEKLNVHIPGATPIDMTNMFVGNNINAQVAVHSTAHPSNPLYDLQAQNSANPIRGQLYLYDNAREYKGGNASGEGNKADWYYLRENIYKDVMEKGYTAEVISDYFAGKKGSDKNDHDKKIKELRGDTIALNKLKEKMIKMSEKCSTFKLDPSKSPGFKVIGVKHLPGVPISATISQASSMLFKAGSDTKFLVELIPNKDNIPLVEGSEFNDYKNSKIKKIVLLKWDGTDFDSSNPISLIDFEALTETDFNAHPDMIKKEGEKLLIQCTFPTSQGEGIYAVKVDGADISGEDSNKFEAYDDSNTASGGFYIIKFYAVGSGPRVRPIQPEGFKKANATFTIEANVIGVDTGGHVYCNIDADATSTDIELKKAVPSDPNDTRYEVEVEIVANTSGKYVLKWKEPSGIPKEKELPDGFSDGKHKIHFLGEAGSGSTDKDMVYFTFDTKAPQVEILSPDLSKNQSGYFTMRGSVVDVPSGVKSTKYIVGKQDTNDITVEPAKTSQEWKPLVLSGDMWSIDFIGADNITQKLKAQTLGKKVEGLATGVELYDIPIFFLVEDKAGKTTQEGNINIIPKIIRVDPNGDIPEVTVLSPEADKTLGGMINISGTVSVPNPAAGQVESMWIQITDKTKAGNPDKPDFDNSAIFCANEWCPSGGKKLASYTAGSPYWSVEINGNKEFNPPDDTPRTIWFRLRGKNTRNVEGQWTKPIKIKIDKTAPTITGMKIATLNNIDTPISSGLLNSENQTYVSNMWIKGDDLYLCANLEHNAGIEMISIGGNYLASSISLTGNEITDYEIHNQKCFVRNGNNYKMRIPLKTMTNPGNNNGFTINITIKAKKSSLTASDLTASNSFSFKYDNTVPTAVFGTKIASSGTVEVSEASFTDPALIGKTNINTSMKFFASGEDIAITAFDGSIGKVTLASAPVKPTKGYLIYAPMEYLRPDSNGKVVVFGAAYDVGAGVEMVKVNYNSASTAEIVLEFPNGVQTDVGNGDVNFVTWKGELDLSGFVDGKGKIIITPIDRANNECSPIEVSVKLKKSPLMISSVELGTDINRNNAIEDVDSTVETKTLTLTYDADKPNGIDSEKYDWHGKADGDAFRFKNNKSYIKIGTVNGSGIKKYTLKCLTNGQSVKGLIDLPADGVIMLNTAEFNKIEQSTGLNTGNPDRRKLLLTVWDSAQGLTCGTDTWKAELELDVIVDTKDRISPTNKINPFEWISETENSLYGNSRDNGHIEIGDGLSAAFTTGGTGLMDRDDKVSGKISITGTAYDDQVITEIWAKIDGFKFDGINGAAESRETKLATFTSGSFTPVGDFDTKGWHFSVVSSDFSVEKGHTVKWQLDWDSSKITDGVGTDKTITVTVKDTAQTNTTPDSRRVDVVPYVTEIVTESTHKSGLNKNTIRSSDGKYSVIKGSTARFIKVKGFNLSSPVVRLVKRTDLPTATETTGEGLTASGSSSEFTLTNDLSKSGYIEVFAGTAKVRAINNINSNEKAYNKEEDLYLLKNKNFNDDRYLRVFDMKTTDVKNGYYPEMIMEGNDPVFGYINLSGAPTGMAGGFRDDHAMPQRAKFNGNTGNTEATEYLIKASIWDQMGMAKDDDGRYYHITIYDRSEAAMSFIYDKYASLHSGRSKKPTWGYEHHASGMGWGSGTGYSNYEGDYSHKEKNNALTLESVNYDSLLLGRYQYPKIIAKGKSKTDKAIVYIAYYDANTTDKEIIFRNFQVGLDGAVQETKQKLYQGSGYSQYTNLVENTENTRTYNTGRLTAVSNASQYFDMGVTSDKRVVLVYFDEAAGKLKLRYSSTAVDGSDPSAAVNWRNASVNFPDYTGTYVSMDIDSNDGIHIAAFDSSNGDLKYFYLNSYNSTALKTALVDAAFSVGQWTQVKVHNNKPYIAYYNNSEAGQRSAIKLAVAKDDVGTVRNGVGTSKKDEANTISSGKYYENGFVTGRWECMTIPTITPAQGGTPKFKKVNLGFDTQDRPVLGYLGSNIEFGKWLDE